MRTHIEHRQRPVTTQLLQQSAQNFQHALACAGPLELCAGGCHNVHVREIRSSAKATTRPNRLSFTTVANAAKLPAEMTHALFFFDSCCPQPFGISVVERSTPERSATVKSGSRRIATPMSAPLNLAPCTLAARRFTLRSCARSKFTLERSHRKNSIPLAFASVKSAPGRIASVRSALRRSALRRIQPSGSSPASFYFLISIPSIFAHRLID